MRRGIAQKVVFGVFFVFAISVAFYFLFPDNTGVPVKEGGAISVYSEDVEKLPEGVSVVEEGGKRILRDERAGYEMEIPSDIKLKTEEDTVLFYSGEPGLPVIGGISVYENTNNLSLDMWLENLHKEVFFTFYDERKKVRFGEIEAIRISVEGEMEYYDYYFKKGNKFIGITLVGDDYSGKFLESVKFFN